MNKTRIALAAFAGILTLSMAMKVAADLRFFSAYDPDLPLNAQILEVDHLDDYLRVRFTYDTVPGESVPAVMTLPLEREDPVPCVVFLHGIGQDKRFLEEIAAPFNAAGFAIVSFDQYTRGERRLQDASAMAQLFAFRQRAASTVNDTRRLVDFLEQYPDVDPDRIFLVGASYGAITGTTAAAFDERFQAVVLVYGGAGIGNLLDAPEIRNAAGRWIGPAKLIAHFLMWPADPIRYAHKIAPRPVLVQNGKEDRLIATEAAVALQEAVQEPKKITWYEGDHIGLDEATVWKVLNEGIAWLQEHDERILKERAAAG